MKSLEAKRSFGGLQTWQQLAFLIADYVVLWFDDEQSVSQNSIRVWVRASEVTHTHMHTHQHTVCHTLLFGLNFMSSAPSVTKGQLVTTGFVPLCQGLEYNSYYSHFESASWTDLSVFCQVAGSPILDLNEQIKMEAIEIEDRRFTFQVTQLSSKKWVVFCPLSF